MQVKQALINLGLSDKEIDTYLALLRLGRGTGYEVTGESGLKKSTTYFTLEELRQKNLVTKIPQSNKVVFVPKDPNELLTTAHQNVIDIESIIPSLLAMTPQNNKPDLLYFEGVPGFAQARSVFAKYAKGNHIQAFYSYHPNPSTEHIDIIKKHFSELAATGTTITYITPDHPTTRSFQKHLQEGTYTVRFLPLDIYNAQSSLEIAGDAIAIMSRDEGQSIIIENAVMANMARSIFNIAWKFAEKYS